MEFNIYRIIDKLKIKRPIFTSEADLQLELAWVIKEEYPNAKVRMEYCPAFDPNMHIDILVKINGKWIPIELKYKTKRYQKIIDNEIYNLRTHGAKDQNCYLYLKDIERIEKIKENANCFQEGYTIFVTNELSYLKKPNSDNVVYYQFSLEDGIIKNGELDWNEKTGEGTKRNYGKSIVLKNQYKIIWQDYSKIDESKAGMFKILINKIS